MILESSHAADDVDDWIPSDWIVGDARLWWLFMLVIVRSLIYIALSGSFIFIPQNLDI